MGNSLQRFWTIFTDGITSFCVKYNRIMPFVDWEMSNLDERVKEEEESIPTSRRLPPGLWEIIVDHDTQRSIISALTTDDCFENGKLSYRKLIEKISLERISSKAILPATDSIQTDPLTPPPPLYDDDNGNLIKQEIMKSNTEEEKELQRTREVVISYVQRISSRNPRISLLVSEAYQLELKQQHELKTLNPETSQILNTQRERRDSLLSTIRSELRMAVITKEEN